MKIILAAKTKKHLKIIFKEGGGQRQIEKVNLVI